MSEVQTILESMKGKFDASAAGDLDVVFQFELEDDSNFNIKINSGSCEIQAGDHSDPSVTLIMKAEVLSGLMDGSIDGMQAFMSGKLLTEGDMMLATRLGELFPS